MTIPHEPRGPLRSTAGSNSLPARWITAPVLALLAELLLAPGAHCGGAGGSIHLGFSDCAGAGNSTSALTNACTTNNGSIVIVGSFSPPVSMQHLVALQAEVGIFTSGTQLSPWWHFEQYPAGCNAGRLVTTFAFDSGPYTCTDVWAGQASGAFDFAINPMGTGPNTATVQMVCAIPILDGVPVNPSFEYYGFKIQISRAASSGPGACAGCTDKACFVFNWLTLEQPAGVGDFTITQGYQNAIAYNGGTGDANCAGSRTQRGSWGAIKAIYR